MNCPKCRSTEINSAGICLVCGFRTRNVMAPEEVALHPGTAITAPNRSSSELSSRSEIPPWRLELSKRLREIKLKREAAGELPSAIEPDDVPPTAAGTRRRQEEQKPVSPGFAVQRKRRPAPTAESSPPRAADSAGEQAQVPEPSNRLEESQTPEDIGEAPAAEGVLRHPWNSAPASQDKEDIQNLIDSVVAQQASREGTAAPPIDIEMRPAEIAASGKEMSGPAPQMTPAIPAEAAGSSEPQTEPPTPTTEVVAAVTEPEMPAMDMAAPQMEAAALRMAQAAAPETATPELQAIAAREETAAAPPEIPEPPSEPAAALPEIPEPPSEPAAAVLAATMQAPEMPAPQAMAATPPEIPTPPTTPEEAARESAAPAMERAAHQETSEASVKMAAAQAPEGPTPPRMTVPPPRTPPPLPKIVAPPPAAAVPSFKLPTPPREAAAPSPKNALPSAEYSASLAPPAIFSHIASKPRENKLILLSRTLAGLVDLIIIIISASALIFTVDVLEGIDVFDGISITHYLMLLLVTYFVYSLFFLSTGTQTMGMMLTDLRLVGTTMKRPKVTQLLVRCIDILLGWRLSEWGFFGGFSIANPDACTTGSRRQGWKESLRKAGAAGAGAQPIFARTFSVCGTYRQAIPAIPQ